MNESDSLEPLLQEWQAPEPAAELDRRVTAAYRSAVRRPAWREFWKMRISIPVPALLLAAVVVFALFLWLRPAAAPPAPAEVPGTATRLNASGFQPLPNGEARVVPVTEIQR